MVPESSKRGHGGGPCPFSTPRGLPCRPPPQHIWRDPCSKPHWPHRLVGPTLTTQAAHVPMGVCAHSPAPALTRPHALTGHSLGPAPPFPEGPPPPEGADSEGRERSAEPLGTGQERPVGSGTLPCRCWGAALWGTWNSTPAACMAGTGGQVSRLLRNNTGAATPPEREALNGLWFCKT